MKRVLKVWVNRITINFYIGTFFMFLMLFCNPYLNIVWLLCALFLFMYGGAYATEGSNLTAGERLFLTKFDKFLENL